jgi:hypothetical protein
MPNWAYNSLTVSGKVEDMDKWRVALANEHDLEPRLSFNKLYPLPEEEKNNWYNWRIQHWGTKWDIADEEGKAPDNSSPTEYFYDFETAWSPPLEWLSTIVKDFPKLKFELGWYEEQMFYGGLTIYEDRILIRDDYYENGPFYDWAENYFGLDFSPDEDWEEE